MLVSMTYTLEELKKIHKESFKNRKKIAKRGHLCGCFSCLEMFDSADIEEWTDGGQTAICPECDIDAVLHDGGEVFILSEELLKQMHIIFFGALYPNN